MKCPSSIWHRTRNGRSRSRAFTFIELIVAVALTVILVRGMYTVFSAASALTRLSEEKTVVLEEAAAVFDYLAADLARSPYTAGNYYMNISADRESIMFQATRLDGVADSYVYIEYYLSEVRPREYELMRAVWTDRDRSDATTEADQGEDGAPLNIGRHLVRAAEETDGIAPFQAWYFDNSQGNIDDTGAWVGPAPCTLEGTSRTRAVRFDITMISDSPEPELAEQSFTQIFPILYSGD